MIVVKVIRIALSPFHKPFQTLFSFHKEKVKKKGRYNADK
jgi:hypothetical protein